MKSNQPSYCLGEIVSSLSDLEKLIKDNPEYRYYELWLAYLGKFDFVELDLFCKKYAESVIVLCRTKDHEASRLQKSDKEKVLEIVKKYNLKFDLDLKEEEESVIFADGLGLNEQMILSYHNYQTTPEIQVLDRIFKDMQAFKPGMYKFSCMVNQGNDQLRLLDFYISNKISNLIVLGMGEEVLLSRLNALIADQPLIYAPRSQAAAHVKGQLTLQQYQELFKILG